MRQNTRWFSALALDALVVALSASIASAQGRRQGGPGFGGPGFGGPGQMGDLQLVQIEQVAKELEIVDDQKQQLTKLSEEAREEMGKLFEGFRDLSREERQAKMEENRKAMEEKQAEWKKKVGDILMPQQQARLKEIRIQLMGNGALADKEVAKELGLTEDQVNQLKTIRDESGTKMRELFTSARENGGDFSGIREKADELRKESSEKSLAVLTKKSLRSSRARSLNWISRSFAVPVAVAGRAATTRHPTRPRRP
jgi:Spy/CpxP family protein refolding chaperone